jgi:hypothetical protein
MKHIKTCSIEQMDRAGARLYSRHVQLESDEQKKKDDDVKRQSLEEEQMFPKLTEMYHLSIRRLLLSTYPRTEMSFSKKTFTNRNLDYSELNIFRKWFAQMCDENSRFLSLPNGTKLEPITGVSIEVNPFEKSFFLVIFNKNK